MKNPEKLTERKFEKKDEIPDAVRNFFEIKNKIEERWQKKIGKKEEVPEAAQDFFKQLDKIGERWQKKWKGKEGIPEAVQDFFKQSDKIGERWQKKWKGKEGIPEAVQDFFKQFPGRPLTEGPPEKRQGKETPVPETGLRRPPVEVERRYPWGKALEKETAVFVKEHLKKAELSPKEKKAIAGNLKKERDAVRIEFAIKWFIKNRDKVEAANFKFEPSNEEHVVRVTGRLGGFNEMDQYRPETETGEEMPTYKEKLENVKALEEDLYKEVVPIESQFLTFNALGKMAERIKGNIGRSPKLSYEKRALKKEYKELFKVRKNLAKNTEKMFSGEEMKGFWKGTWEKKMKELDLNLEEAIGLTEDIYKTVKERIATEFTLKELKKEPKSRQALEQIELGFRGIGRDCIPFIDKITHRRGLEGLTSDWDEDKTLLGDFLRAEGIVDLSDARLDETKIALERRMPYEKAVKEQIGFVRWLINFIFQSLSLPKEAEKG